MGIAEGLWRHTCWDLSLYYFQPSVPLQKGQESFMSTCVCSACLPGNKVQRRKSIVRRMDFCSLSKPIRGRVQDVLELNSGLRVMKEARVRDILRSGAHQTVVLGQSGIDFHSFGDEGGWRFWGRGKKWGLKTRESRETKRGNAAVRSRGVL